MLAAVFAAAALAAALVTGGGAEAPAGAAGAPPPMTGEYGDRGEGGSSPEEVRHLAVRVGVPWRSDSNPPEGGGCCPAKRDDDDEDEEGLPPPRLALVVCSEKSAASLAICCAFTRASSSSAAAFAAATAASAASVEGAPMAPPAAPNNASSVSGPKRVVALLEERFRYVKASLALVLVGAARTRVTLEGVAICSFQQGRVRILPLFQFQKNRKAIVTKNRKAGSCRRNVKHFLSHLLSHGIAFDEKAGHAELSLGSEVRPGVRKPAQRSSEARKYERVVKRLDN